MIFQIKPATIRSRLNIKIVRLNGRYQIAKREEITGPNIAIPRVTLKMRLVSLIVRRPTGMCVMEI